MTTRRERLEARLERRREWMASRQRKAAERFSQADPYRGDVAFNTQPGHIPERARVIRATEKGFEHAQMARHHGAKADGLEHQLERCIFSDDPDAVEALQVRILELEADRDRRKASNAAFRKGDAVWSAFLGITPEQAAVRRQIIMEGYSWCQQPHPTYELTNLGGNIRRLKQRIVDVQRRQERQAAAEAAPGGVSIEGGDYVAVTFPEKPSREVLDALRGAGFRWSGGSWCGERAKLPASVLGMVQS